jgi:hypothetical protein
LLRALALARLQPGRNVRPNSLPDQNREQKTSDKPKLNPEGQKEVFDRAELIVCHGFSPFACCLLMRAFLAFSCFSVRMPPICFRARLLRALH